MGKKPTQDKSPQAAGRRRWVLYALLAGIALGLWSFLQFYPRYLISAAATALPEDVPTAERLLRRAALFAAHAEEAQVMLCRVLGEQGEWDDAYQIFQEIDRPEEAPPEELLRLADVARQAGVFGMAAEVLDKASRLPDTSPDIIEQLAMLHVPVLVKLGRNAEALESCRRWSAAKPASAEPWAALASIHQQQGQILPAIEAYRESLVRAGNHRLKPQWQQQLVQLLVRSGNTTEARKRIEPLLADPQLAPSVRLPHAQLLRLEGHVDEALQEVQRYLDEQPQHMAALMLRGVLRLDKDQYQAAREDLQKVVAEQPFNKESHYKLGIALRELGQEEQAGQHFERSRELTETAVQILELEMRLAHDPKDQESLRELAKRYEQVGRQQEARQTRRQLKF